MNIIAADFETYYDKDFSLSKITMEEYIRSPLFEVIGVSTKVGDGPIIWVSGDFNTIKTHLLSLPWGNHLMLAQNTAFDAAILNWVFGIKPVGYLDTMSMANALHGLTESSSLANLAKLYGEVDKGNAVVSALGKRRADFSKAELAGYGEYCDHDVELCYNIFHKMMPNFPKQELRVVDLTIRMYAEPRLMLDSAMLVTDLAKIRKDKQASMQTLMDVLGVTSEVDLKTQLMSNPKFADLLTSRGVEPPTKISDKTGKEAYAFAKTDEEFIALMDSDDPVTSTLVSTRLAQRSTIGETRTEAYVGIASRGAYPFSLRYSGAMITHRWSGFDTNPQNLPRGSILRDSIMAPEGHTLVVSDLSNIELRLGMWLAGQEDALIQIANGIDLYRVFASEAFNIPYDQIAKDSIERFIAKVCCIAEGELVLTPRGLIPIEEITLDDSVWDGVEWVAHTGVVYMGEKEVITYDGLTATTDHKVWTEDGRYIRFGEAASGLDRLATTGDGRKAIRYVADTGQADNPQGETPVRERSMPMRATADNCARESDAWVEQPMPLMRDEASPHKTGAPSGDRQPDTTDSETSECNGATMQQYKRQELPQLWWARDSIPLRFCGRVCSVLTKLTQLLRGAISGQGKQQWALRARESTIHNTKGTDTKQKDYSNYDIQRESNPQPCSGACDSRYRPSSGLRGEHPIQSSDERIVGRTDNSAILPEVSKTKRVYDITNAGHRHRFTVSGKLVSNCLSLIYGTGAAKLKETIRVQSKGKVTVSIAEAERLKDLYREKNTDVVNAWQEGTRVLNWIKNDLSHTAFKIIPVLGNEGLIKPSGLALPYPSLDLTYGVKGDEWHYTVRRGRATIRDKVYGAKVFQRATQSIARDIMADMTTEINKDWWVAGLVHDEVLTIVPDERVTEATSEIERIMSTSPIWAPDLPLACEVGSHKRYGGAK